MAKTSKARPATKPARASALADGAAIDDHDAKARRLAGVETRKKTVASTMVYAGLGVRASERVKKAVPTVKEPAAKRLAEEPESVTPETELPEQPVGPARVRDIADQRKRPRTQSQLIGRLVDTIDGQLDQIDAIMRNPDRGDAGSNEAERHARTVAALARVTVELRKELEAGRRRRADDVSSRDRERSHRPDRPRDLDELRERLSRRLEEWHRSGSQVSVADDAAGRGQLPD